MTQSHEKLLRWISTASVATAAFLTVVKLMAWWMTDSVGVLASLIDSMLDMAASLINFFAIRYALQPPDEEHRFGHGKAEAIAGLAQSTFIAGSAVFLLIQTVERFFNPVALEHTHVGMGVMLLSIVVTATLVIFQRIVILRTQSTAIKADSLHYLTDLLSNVGVLAALFIASMGFPQADPIIALLLGLYIMHSAWEIGQEAFEHLMDRELPDEDKAKIRAIVQAEPGVLGIHELKTRKSGAVSIIQMHLEMKGELSLNAAHDIADRVEMAIRRAFPGADVITHQDPAGIEEPGQQHWDV